MYLAVSLRLCHSRRSSILCGVLACINAIPDQYAASHGHLCIACQWRNDRTGRELTAPCSGSAVQACREGKHTALENRVVFQWVLSNTTAITWGVEQCVTEITVLGGSLEAGNQGSDSIT